ncbi:carbohydrate kinase family protein [Candidatus Hecatella orcuttiae]|uniref:carbohydrate kinase family protein n=1 Tax=Candidatus Hecatella orcuttiae TaxID=1935119 RepID=UPI002868024B|nr:carbohydrate kinase family protein [Candidatus Hecatella orcuttiae]
MPLAGPTLLFIGHVSLDRVRNPWGERLQLGGAALYAALGAKVLYDRVKLISAVGKDFKQLSFLHSTFPGSLIRRVNAPTTSFDISYDQNFQARYDAVRLGAGAAIKVADLPAHWVSRDVYVHLAPMRPQKVEKFAARIRKLCPETWVSIHSSPDYLGKAENRRILRKLAEKADLMVVNDQEASALAETGSLTSALSALKAKRLAVTLGQMGAILVEEGRMQMIPALSGLKATLKDTTGAGDTWCGTLLAAYALSRDWTKAVVAACLISAVKCLGWGFERLRRLRLKSLEDIAYHVLKLREGTVQSVLEEFLGEKP